jgi:Bucentaur or craniofacial development
MPTLNTDGRNNEVSSLALTPAQQQRVDSTFQELFGYPWGTQFAVPSTSESSSNEDEEFVILSSMLGPTPAARILSRFQSRPSFRKLLKTGAKSVTVHKRTHAVKAPILGGNKSRPLHDTKTSQSEDYHRTIQGKSTTKSDAFGGEPLRANDSAAAQKPSSAGGVGVDVLLQQLNATGKVSTVAKTSADWDQFKQATGLGATLEEQADSSTSYLNKQDFLSRVDHRTFDLEKRERDVQRAKRGL